MEKQNIYESLMAINKEVDAIKKDKKNEQHITISNDKPELLFLSEQKNKLK